MQEKSADCGKNCTFLVESQKGCTKGQCTKYKGQDNSQKSNERRAANWTEKGRKNGVLPSCFFGDICKYLSEKKV